MNVLSKVHYVAFVLQPKRQELAELVIPRSSGDNELLTAIRTLQRRCSEHAGLA